MKSPKVDIIIPAYNQGHYLQASVESALAQTWQNIEVLIVNDGSTDNTAEVAQSFADPRVTYIYRKNGGLSAARNTGLKHVTGEFVSFLDSDDLFYPRNIELLLNEFEKNPTLGMCAGDTVRIDEDGEIVSGPSGHRVPGSINGWLMGNPVAVGSMLVKHDWLRKIDHFDESLRACEDWDMWIRLSMIGCPMHSIPDVVFKYRIHGQQMTRGLERMRTARLRVLEKNIGGESADSTFRRNALKDEADFLLNLAAKAFLAEVYEVATENIQLAVNISPDLEKDSGAKLCKFFTDWAYSPLVKNPSEFLAIVQSHCPINIQLQMGTAGDFGK